MTWRGEREVNETAACILMIVGINFSLHIHVMCIIKDLISAKNFLIPEKKTYGG